MRSIGRKSTRMSKKASQWILAQLQGGWCRHIWGGGRRKRRNRKGRLGLWGIRGKGGEPWEESWGGKVQGWLKRLMMLIGHNKCTFLVTLQSLSLNMIDIYNFGKTESISFNFWANHQKDGWCLNSIDQIITDMSVCKLCVNFFLWDHCTIALYQICG